MYVDINVELEEDYKLGAKMTHSWKCRELQITAFFILACRAIAQTTPPPPGMIQTLYRFTINSPDGDSPLGGLILGDDGNLYGTTSSGGDKTCRCGTIFRITTDGALTTVFTFTAATGGKVSSPLVKDRQGNLYGTTGDT